MLNLNDPSKLNLKKTRFLDRGGGMVLRSSCLAYPGTVMGLLHLPLVGISRDSRLLLLLL
jgi:hypothetical protein